MPQKIVEIPGVGNVEFPDSMSDSDISAVIRKQSDPNASVKAAQAAKFPTAAEGGAPDLPWYAGLFNRGDPSSPVTQALERLPGVLENTAPGADTGMDSPAVKLLQTAIPGSAATAGMGLAEAFKSGPLVKPAANLFNRMMPSAERAGANFQTIMGAAKDVPLDTSQAYKVGERTEQLAAHGSSAPPKPLSDFMKLAKPSTAMVGGQPVAIEPPPMTYETGRDFASAAGRLSATEAAGMDGPMKAQLTQFAQAMKTANREAAASVGMGKLYDAAMKEYRQAKTIEDAAEILKKWVPRAVAAMGLGAAGAAGVKLYQELK